MYIYIYLVGFINQLISLGGTTLWNPLDDKFAEWMVVPGIPQNLVLEA